MKGNLLIVDDEPFILIIIKNRIEGIAEKIYLANDGIEALEVLKKETIHCVICDINMPRMNGVEVIKNIRAAKNEVPFIFYTAHGNHDLMLEAARYGAFEFLSKPNMDDLESVIDRGLKEGIDRSLGVTVSEDVYMSEYLKLLDRTDTK
jgi:YesN/AraC family two-component response regulator